MALSLKEAGSAPTLPGFGFASLESTANSTYQSEPISAIEMAAKRLATRFGLSASRARTVVELAGMEGRA
jgi:hypothetical protein